MRTMGQERQQENDKIDEDVDSEEEGLQLLLAGISSNQMANANWPDDDDDDDDDFCSAKDQQVIGVRVPCPTKSSSKMKAPRVDLDECSSCNHESEMLIKELSWNIIESSGLLVPPSVRIVSFGSRGNGLVATRPFKKGSVIFTERALFSNSSHEPTCCNCWRSLSHPDDVAPNLPKSQLLWPTAMTSIYKHECGSMFCSSNCKTTHEELFGSCCRLRKCLQVVPSTEEAIGILHLSIVVFVAAVHRYRSSNYTIKTSEGPLGLIWDDLCGTSQDVVPLELDESLESIYNDLTHILELNVKEQIALSQDHFASYISKVARNSFESHTKSPFDSYYGCLNRAERAEVVKALGGTLTRLINRQIKDKVVVPVAAIFGLTSRINHSCDPNVEAMSQNYIDCHMDVVARRDLEIGEELLISYLAETKSPARRRRILEAKYLFLCNCSRCIEEGALQTEEGQSSEGQQVVTYNR